MKPSSGESKRKNEGKPVRKSAIGFRITSIYNRDEAACRAAVAEALANLDRELHTPETPTETGNAEQNGTMVPEVATDAAVQPVNEGGDTDAPTSAQEIV